MNDYARAHMYYADVQAKERNYFRYSKCARAHQVVLADLRFDWIIALVLTYLWLEYHGVVLSVTDLPQIQRCHQP